MKILVLSDIHANLAALEAVLAAEPERDLVVFCGDAVDVGGPVSHQPVAVTTEVALTDVVAPDDQDIRFIAHWLAFRGRNPDASHPDASSHWRLPGPDRDPSPRFRRRHIAKPKPGQAMW